MKGKNSGIIVSGGSLEAKNIAVGSQAKITSSDATTDSQEAEITELITLVRNAIDGYLVKGSDEHRAAIEAIDTVSQQTCDAELTDHSTVKSALESLSKSVGNVTSIASSLSRLAEIVFG